MSINLEEVIKSYDEEETLKMLGSKIYNKAKKVKKNKTIKVKSTFLKD